MLSNSNTQTVFFISLLMILISPDLAHAQDAALFDSGTNFLTAFVDLLTNVWARLVAVAAIVIIGFQAAAGRLTWMRAGMVILGIILIFGAGAIVDSIAGSL